MTHASHAVAHPLTDIAANLDNAPHRSSQNPNAVAQQTAVSRIVDV
jgi:hypothetical protein